MISVPGRNRTIDTTAVGPDQAAVVVRLLRIPDSADAAEAAAEVLDASEARRAAAFQDPAARIRYLTSHVALRVLLGSRLGVPPGAVAFVRERCGMPNCALAHGRPAVAGHPRSHFSMSHAGDFALYALAAVPVGADIESLRLVSGALGRTAGRLHPAERQAIAALPAASRAQTTLGCAARAGAAFRCGCGSSGFGWSDGAALRLMGEPLVSALGLLESCRGAYEGGDGSGPAVGRPGDHGGDFRGVQYGHGGEVGVELGPAGLR